MLDWWDGWMLTETVTEDALVSFMCFGSTFDQCCAGRSSMMTFARVFDFSDPSSPRSIGDTILPGHSPIRGETYGETRGINDIRIDGSAVITDETLIYPESSGAIEHDPYATVEVTHRFVDGRWESKERVR